MWSRQHCACFGEKLHHLSRRPETSSYVLQGEEDSEESGDLSLAEDETSEFSDESQEGLGKTRSQARRQARRAFQEHGEVHSQSGRRVTRSGRVQCISEEEFSARGTDESDEEPSYHVRRSSATVRGRWQRPVSSNVRCGEQNSDRKPMRETRTSNRSVPRKSYAEAEESEEEDHRAKKRAKVGSSSPN